MSHCSSVCGSSAPLQSASSGARLLNLLRESGKADGGGRSDGPRVSREPSPSPTLPPAAPSGGSGVAARSLFDLLSAEDTDGTGNLSPDEIAQTPAAGLMSDVFGLIDRDGDGALNAGEVGEYESAVNEVLTAAGSPAGIAQLLAGSGEGDRDEPHGGHGRADRADGDHRHRHQGHQGHDRIGPRMDEATATVVADALTGVLDAMDADSDGTLTSAELTAASAPADGSDGIPDTGATATSLSASIFQALTSQIGASDDTTALAHQYTRLLQALRG